MKMMMNENASITGHTLQLNTLAAYVDHETQHWRDWFDHAPPEVLDLPLGPGTEGTVRILVKHIFAVELRYAQRLTGDRVSEYDELPDTTIAELWQIHDRARETMDRFLSAASAADMDRVLVSETRKLGRIESRAHTVALHSWIHGIRHWAQIAMVLRQHGHAGLWEHDWLLNPAVQ